LNIDKLIEAEAELGFDDVNAIRGSRVRSFLDEWVVTGLLGRGSFGNVYQIVKPQQGMTVQRCALKICQVADSAGAEIRRQEIETQKLLDGHANAVQIEDFAFIYRKPPRMSYLLIRMELLDPLPDNGLSERQTIRMGIDICKVLERCASMQPKLIHCDIKPANILVAPDGRFKLGDFGTAKTLMATMTYTGNRGTPLYMAPEVATFTGYDSRCDIFSLGYTMLTMLNGGRHPYQDGNDKTEVLRAMYEANKPLQILGVSSGLMRIIRKMCEPNLYSRYSRASEVRRDLEQLVRKNEEAEKKARIAAERRADRERAKAKLAAERQAEQERKKARIAAERQAEQERKEAELAAERQAEQNRKNERKAPQAVVGEAKKTADSAKTKAGNASHNASFRWEQEDKRRRLQNQRTNNVQSSAIKVRPDAASTRSENEHRTDSHEKNRSETIRGNRYVWLGSAAAVVVLAVLISMSFLPDMLDRKEQGSEMLGFAWTTVSGIEGADIGFSSDDEPPRSSADVEVLEPEALSVCTENGICLSYDEVTNGYVVDDFSGYYAGEIEIPESYDGIPIVAIGDDAFRFCETLKGITIPSGVTRIGGRAFSNCTSLRSISMPDGLITIGDRAFYNCKGLKQVIIPDSVESIGVFAFNCCENLVEIKLPEKLKSISEGMFYCCYCLEQIAVPDGVTSVGNEAFYECGKLKKVELPDGVTAIGDSAFIRCHKLKEVIIPQNLETIGDDAFRSCLISKIVLPDTIRSIGERAFYSCNMLTNVTLPEGEISIGKDAFGYCYELSVHAPHEDDYYGTKMGNYKRWIVE